MEQQSKEEILNLDHHKRRLCLLALNKGCCMESAARMLGISGHMLREYKKQYGITFDRQKNSYIIKAKKNADQARGRSAAPGKAPAGE